MRRRDFVGGLGGTAPFVPLAGRAQQPQRIRRMAIIIPVQPSNQVTEAGVFYWRSFFTELRRLGDIEGKNLIVERYSAEGHSDRITELVRQAVKSRPDLIVAADTPVALAAKTATRTIPIIANMGDPLKYGLVQSVARPGGNLIGISFDPGFAIYAKPLQFLKEVLPSASRMAVLALHATWKDPLASYMRHASRELGISLIEEPLADGSRAEIANSLARVVRARADAVYFNHDAVFYVHRQLVLDFLEKNRLPASFLGWNEIVEDGGLMSYGDDISDNFRRLARIVHKVLAGVNPGDIPISQPTKFVLAINLKTAKVLGLTVPPSLLARADEVIE